MPEIARQGLLAFVHIPKAAGTTLSTLLGQQFAPEQVYKMHQNGSAKQIRRFKAALKQRQGSLRLIQGHIDLSLGSLLPPDTRFFTVLRDPVERAISHYYQYRRATTDELHPLAMRSTLQQWVSNCGLTEMDNGQTRRLAGKVDLPVGTISAQTLEEAKANIAAKFTVVGLAEQLEESLVLLHRAFDWPFYRYPVLNVGDNRLRRAEIEDEIVKAIENCNRFDLELYRFAAERFRQATSGIDMASGLALLRNAPEYAPPVKLIQAAPARPASPIRSAISSFRSLFPT